MKILVDMNLTPEWVKALQQEGFEAVHWSTIGKVNASDHEIMKYASSNNYIVFTHDLDFGNILAVTGLKAPSVLQVRTEDTIPDILKPLVVKALRQFEERLNQGALITVVSGKMRARILPLKK